jgi:hypothetical protein
MTPKQSRITCYNKLPIKISQKEFNEFIKPCLSRGRRGPKARVSFYKIFNYIIYVLHTGMQWQELRTLRNEISWQAVYHYHNRWSKDGSYLNLFEHSVDVLNKTGKLDLSILHGDGSNVVAKKGVRK